HPSRRPRSEGRPLWPAGFPRSIPGLTARLVRRNRQLRLRADFRGNRAWVSADSQIERACTNISRIGPLEQLTVAGKLDLMLAESRSHFGSAKSHQLAFPALLEAGRSAGEFSTAEAGMGHQLRRTCRQFRQQAGEMRGLKAAGNLEARKVVSGEISIGRQNPAKTRAEQGDPIGGLPLREGNPQRGRTKWKIKGPSDEPHTV